MSKLTDATNIINNLVKFDAPVPANDIINLNDEDEISDFTTTLKKANSFINAWARQGFVLLVQNEVLTLEESIIDPGTGEIVTQPVYNLDEIIGFDQGVISWLIENGSELDEDDDGKFGNGKNFLPEYTTAWIEAIFDIARYWFENNITPSENIISGESVIFSDSPNSSYKKDVNDVQNYIPQDTMNKLINAKFKDFINGNDLPETLQAALFVKKTELNALKKDVSNNTNEISEIVKVVNGEVNTKRTAVENPPSESLGGQTTQQGVNQENKVQITDNKNVGTTNTDRINNLENAIGILLFNAKRSANSINFPVTVTPVDLAFDIIESEFFELKNPAASNPLFFTNITLKAGKTLKAGNYKIPYAQFFELVGVNNNDSGTGKIELYDSNDLLISSSQNITITITNQQVEADIIGTVEINIPSDISEGYYFKFVIQILAGGFNAIQKIDSFFELEATDRASLSVLLDFPIGNVQEFINSYDPNGNDKYLGVWQKLHEYNTNMKDGMTTIQAVTSVVNTFSIGSLISHLHNWLRNARSNELNLGGNGRFYKNLRTYDSNGNDSETDSGGSTNNPQDVDSNGGYTNKIGGSHNLAAGIYTLKWVRIS